MSTPPEFDPAFRDDFQQLVRWRRDVREFRADPVPPSLLDECLALADLAPSVGLSQPWRFVPVTDASRRQDVIRSFERCNADALASYRGEKAALYARLKLEGLRESPCQLAVFCEQDTDQGAGLGRATMPETLEYSTVMAIHTFWLAARSHGLGVGWLSILDPGEVAAALAVPASWKLVAYLCVGWPRESSATPRLETDGWERRRQRHGGAGNGG